MLYTLYTNRQTTHKPRTERTQGLYASGGVGEEMRRMIARAVISLSFRRSLFLRFATGGDCGYRGKQPENKRCVSAEGLVGGDEVRATLKEQNRQ